MKPLQQYLRHGTAACIAMLGLNGALQAGDFSYPQGVYNGEPVVNAPASNGVLSTGTF